LAKPDKRTDPDILAKRLSLAAARGGTGEWLALVPWLMTQYPDHAGINRALSELMLAVKDIPRALGFARKAAVLDQGDLNTQVHLALVLIADKQEAQARAQLLEVERRLPDSATAHAELAGLFVRVSDHNRAVEHYRRSIELEPNNARNHFSLAATLRFLGQLDAAESSCDRAVAIDPREYETYLIRADLRRQTAEKNHIREMEQVLEGGVSHYLGESMLCHALAKECEDIGAWDKSFAYLARGASARRRHLDYTVETDIRLIDEITRCFTSERLVSPERVGNPAVGPIFIIGMPRTGTTLVERILGSHSQVTALGELPNFPQIMARFARETAGSRKLSQFELVAASLVIDMERLGLAYIESTRGHVVNTSHFIDKLPFNYLNIGLIHLALPEARIIRVTRDPMDTCYAIYKTLFQRAYPFSYDLDDLVEYYLAYSRLMQHWNAVLPGRMLEVRYEAVVADPEAEGRRMAQYCGLDWQEQMSRFHESTDASTTASASQVRQPVYQTSIGKWRNYAHQLEPLVRKLRSAGIEVETGEPAN